MAWGNVGCTHVTPLSQLSREPSAQIESLENGDAREGWGGGGLNEEETAQCEDSKCNYFIAPCSLREHSPLFMAPGSTAPPTYLSMKEDDYLDEFDTYATHGYCQLPPRLLSSYEYNKDTCLYVFVRRPSCQ